MKRERKVCNHAPAGSFLDDLIVTETEEAIPTDPLSENESGQRGWPNAPGGSLLPEEAILGDIAKALEE